jgi:hypothetical protein
MNADKLAEVTIAQQNRMEEELPEGVGFVLLTFNVGGMGAACGSNMPGYDIPNAIRKMADGIEADNAKTREDN